MHPTTLARSHRHNRHMWETRPPVVGHDQDMTGLVGNEAYSPRTRERLRYIAQRSTVLAALLIVATIAVAVTTDIGNLVLVVAFVVGVVVISIVVMRNVDDRFPPAP